MSITMPELSNQHKALLVLAYMADELTLDPGPDANALHFICENTPLMAIRTCYLRNGEVIEINAYLTATGYSVAQGLALEALKKLFA